MSRHSEVMAPAKVRVPRVSREFAGLAALAVVLLAATAAVALTVTYQQIDKSGPPKVFAKVAGDVDGDGIADAVIGSASGGVYWYKNPNSANPPNWVKHTINATIKTAEELKVADIDGGGKDVVVAIPGNGASQKPGAVWFHNNGNGSGWVQKPLETGDGLHDIEVADIDRDGKPDVIGRGDYPNGKQLLVWRQLPGVAWARTAIALPEAGTGLAVADLDRDGKPDVATGKYWYKNTSTIGHIAFIKYTYNSTAEQDALVAAGNINADGRLDLLVTPPHPKLGGTHEVAWYEAPTDPTKTWTKHVLESNAQPVVHTGWVVDVDGDGDNDILTAMDSLGTNPNIKIYLNSGNGVFAKPIITPNANTHAGQILTVAGKKALFGADYNKAPHTSIDLWRCSP